MNFYTGKKTMNLGPREFGCVRCMDEGKPNLTRNARKRFIKPYTHMAYCEEHKQEGMIPLLELVECDDSWLKWKQKRFGGGEMQ